MESFDGTINAGRKGISYDWQSLYIASQAESMDAELARMTPEYAE